MNTNFEGPIVVLGAGPTGLGAAWRLHQAGYGDWAVYEAEPAVGGMSKSFQDEKGFTWDVGGHITFSHYGLFSRLLDGLLGQKGWIEHERESWIRLLDTWVPYPFQNNLHRLPPEQRAACLEGLIQAALEHTNAPCVDFADFIHRTFGRGIADLFMTPYNFKVWARHPKKMDAGWIADRVAVPDAGRVARNVALGRDDVAWGPNSTFRFPRHGGTGAIWEAVAAELPEGAIHLNAAAVELDVEGKRVLFSNGEQVQYKRLISTIPLNRLAQISGRKQWIEPASDLVYSSTYVVGVGLEGTVAPQLASKCWMYFPEDNCPFYRVTHFSLYSPNNVDDIGAHWSLMCEVSESADKPEDADKVVDRTLAGLVAAGLIDSTDRVTHTWMRRFEYTYPTPTRERDAVLRRLHPQLAEAGILSRGRFGAWLYEVGNMDHCFMQGYEAVSHLLYGSPELTVWNPALVNSPDPVLGWDRIG